MDDTINANDFITNLILSNGGTISPGENLRVAMDRMDLSVGKFSKQTNIPPKLLREYITDKKKIKKEHIKVLCENLGLAPASLTCKIQRPYNK